MTSIGLLLSTSPLSKLSEVRTGKIFTVQGAITPKQLGTCLTHEHVMSNFGGEKSLVPAYDQAKLFSQVLPYLKKVKSLGCDSLADCTTAYFGRDVEMLKSLSEQSGVHIITNTGYYGAAADRYVPEHAFEEDAEAIALRWLKEWEEGIADSKIVPGFIKVAVDGGPLSTIDEKLFRAAAITHRQSGLLVACHTGNNPEAARQQLEILQEEGVSPSAWVWTHANQCSDVTHLIKAARQGGWVSLDGVREASIELHINYLKSFKKEGLLERVLLSHDGNSYPRGGDIRPYEALFTQMLPKLAEEGFSAKELHLLTVKNPQKAFTVQIRKV